MSKLKDFVFSNEMLIYQWLFQYWYSHPIVNKIKPTYMSH